MSKTIDLTGRRFGRLVVIGRESSDKVGHARWLCRCECGTEKIILATSLIRGSTTSCGCYQRQRTRETSHIIDISGQRFGRLVAVRVAGKTGSGEARWECLCDCGKIKTVRYGHLKSGAVKSCGCWNHSPKKHGMTAKGERPRIYGIWVGMKQRCTNPNVDKYPRYGGRGVKVCQEWMTSFEAFYKWAMSHGYRDDLTIDRIDNDGNYTPENCRWVTNAENIRNR